MDTTLYSSRGKTKSKRPEAKGISFESCMIPLLATMFKIAEERQKASVGVDGLGAIYSKNQIELLPKVGRRDVSLLLKVVGLKAVIVRMPAVTSATINLLILLSCEYTMYQLVVAHYYLFNYYCSC